MIHEMKISIDRNVLLQIAEEIQRNCDLLGYTDAEDAEDDVAFYVPVIRNLADDLQALVMAEMPQEGKKEAI